MNICEINKENVQEIAEKLNKNDIEQLFNLIETKDRCVAFPVLSYRSRIESDVYPYWDKIAKMLGNENSFVKTIGLKLIANNTKWDKNKKLNINEYLKLCDDSSLVVSRACIQSLEEILNNTKFNSMIVESITKKLSTFDVQKRPETHKNVLKKDIDYIIKLIKNKK